MLGFPLPYPGELIYSLVARTGIHSGISSPKVLLDGVYGDRKIVATIDLPSHLQKIAEQYPESMNLDVPSLIYQHTLFPIYAPFIKEAKRQAGLQWMALQSKGAIHLAFGVAASSVKRPKFLRYCPLCFEAQLEYFGECYWKRIWQVSGAELCLNHQVPLYEFAIIPRHEHRHMYHAASQTDKDLELNILPREANRVAGFVSQLFAVNPQKSPSFYQWDCYYRDLVVSAECYRGRHTKHGEVSERIHYYWSKYWLSEHGLSVTFDDTCWSRSILRKHRKAFSFLQHLVIQSSLQGDEIQFDNVLEQVKQYPVQPKVYFPSSEIEPDVRIKEKRRDWLRLIKKFGCQQARKRGGNAVYAWLYRHDYDWLIKINKRFQRPAQYENQRVNWKSRDGKLVRKLFYLLREYEKDYSSPRLSRTFLLGKLGAATMVERNVDKLPLTKRFLFVYSESVAQYQIRRLSNAFLFLYHQGIQTNRWRLLRASGISEERLMPLAGWFLKGVTEGLWESTDLSISLKMR